MKDHEIRELVDELARIAVTYAGSQQLREQISKVLLSVIKGSKVFEHSISIDTNIATSVVYPKYNDVINQENALFYKQ